MADFGITYRNKGGKEARQYRSGGLWLLRPTRNDEFELIACLSWVTNEGRPLYDLWERNLGHFRETILQDQPIKPIKPITITVDLQ
jgi:hypothetical protein